MKSRPNILFIMADQWHYRDFGYRNHPIVKTPNLDRLHAQSIDFTHAYAQNAFCLPSRASILTGQYLRTHRQYGFTGLFDESTRSLPALLRENGYHTFHVGKFHCNTFGDRLGFDEFIPTLPEDMYQSTDPNENYLAWCREIGLDYPNDQVHGDEFRKQLPPEPLVLGGNRLNIYGTSSVPLEKSIERYTSDRAVAFLERSPSDKPFYLSVSFDRPHGPWSPSPEDAALYNPDDIPLPDELTEAEFNSMPDHIRNYLQSGKESIKQVGPAGMRTILALYYALISRVDHEIGRVLDALEDSGQADNTVIVFCTDHGDMAGNLGLFNKYSNTIYHDDIICTPLLLKLPEGLSGAKPVEQCVELIDIFPTLCQLAGVDTGSLPLDGSSLLDLPEALNRPWGGTAFSESYGIKTVISEGWKLIYYVNRDEGELYHLLEDPRERQNRYADPACQSKRIELLCALVAFFTPVPSEARQAYIRSLFDDTDALARQTMGPLFKWDKGIIEGAGFWQNFREEHRLTVIPFDRVCQLDQLDADEPTDGVVWNYTSVDNPDLLEAMLGQLVDYVSGKIRPISLMSGGPAGMENMMFNRGFGFC